LFRGAYTSVWRSGSCEKSWWHGVGRGTRAWGQVSSSSWALWPASAPQVYTVVAGCLQGSKGEVTWSGTCPNLWQCTPCPQAVGQVSHEPQSMGAVGRTTAPRLIVWSVNRSPIPKKHQGNKTSMLKPSTSLKPMCLLQSSRDSGLHPLDGWGSPTRWERGASFQTGVQTSPLPSCHWFVLRLLAALNAGEAGNCGGLQTPGPTLLHGNHGDA
jgi:hypothetical protein